MDNGVHDEEKAFASLTSEIEKEYFRPQLDDEIAQGYVNQQSISAYLINYKSKGLHFYEYAESILAEQTDESINRERLIQYRNMDLIENSKNSEKKFGLFSVNLVRRKRTYFNSVGLIIVIILAMLFIMKYMLQ